MMDQEFSKPVQKCLRCLKEHCLQWKEVVEKSKCHPESIVNLAEQLQSCHLVEIQHTPLSDFLDVKSLLVYKLTNEMQAHLDELYCDINMLDHLYEKISKSRKVMMDCYLKQSKKTSVEETVVRSALYPSVADMLEWIEQLCEQWHILSCSMKFYVENVNFDDIQSLKDLQQNWKMDQDLVNFTESTLCRLQYIMDDCAI